MDTGIRIENFRLKSNASFAIREGWLAKGLRNVESNPGVFGADNATEILGVGSAMVKSLRSWLQAAGLTTEGKGGVRKQSLTPLGQLIRENDPYFEDPFSLFAVHYHIATNKELTTVWYLLFNHFSETRFSKEGMTGSLLETFREMTGKSFSENSFRDDCGTALRTYVPDDMKQGSPEDNMQCPLAVLGLFSKLPHGRYERTMPSTVSLHAQTVLYYLLNAMKDRDSISLDKVLSEPGNIGCMLHLNAYRLNAYLDDLQSDGSLTIQRTAGLNMIYPRKGLTATEVATNYYRR